MTISIKEKFALVNRLRDLKNQIETETNLPFSERVILIKEIQEIKLKLTDNHDNQSNLNNPNSSSEVGSEVSDSLKNENNPDRDFLQSIIDGQQNVLADGFHDRLNELVVKYKDDHSQDWQELLNLAIESYATQLFGSVQLD